MEKSGLFAEDQVELEMQFIESEKVVLSENNDTKLIWYEYAIQNTI